MLDRLKNEFQIVPLEDVRGRDAQNGNVSACEPSGSLLVMANLFCGVVCGAFDFDSEPHRGAIEVENVGTDWMLATEAKAAHAAIAESLPEEGLRARSFSPQGPRAFEGQDRAAHC